MKKRQVVNILLLITLILTMTACSKEEHKLAENEITVFNWGEYMDPEAIEEFEKETGYKVNYRVFSTNEEMYPKLVTGAEKYDVIIPSDYMIQRLIEEDMLAEIDFDNVPNAKNIDKVLHHLAYDKDDKYSVPYFWGTVGILYNERLLDEVPDSWDAFFDEKNKDKILMYDSERDSFMVALARLGYSMNTKDKGQIEEAKEMLIKQKDLVLAYVIDELQDKMVSEEAALALVWSGEAAFAMEENPDLKFALPKETSNLWVDAMVIPKNCHNKKGAETFINFMCRDDIALKNMEYTGYTSGNINVKEMLDKDWAESIASYPPDDFTKRCETFKYSPENLKFISRAWLEVKQY